MNCVKQGPEQLREETRPVTLLGFGGDPEVVWVVVPLARLEPPFRYASIHGVEGDGRTSCSGAGVIVPGMGVTNMATTLVVLVVAPAVTGRATLRRARTVVLSLNYTLIL